MITRFLTGVYDNTILATNGASYTSKTIEIPEIGKSITLDIWDTAGQEKYKSLNKFFYQDAKIVILVYDITQKYSFDNLKNGWYKDLKEYGDPNIVIGIAGSKSDRYEEELSQNKKQENLLKVLMQYSV